MQENICYNVEVPKTLEKKNVNFSLKVPESLLEVLGKIGEKEDRPLGYIGRELMIRGLAQYRIDGRLRDETAGKPVIESPKLARVENMGEITDERKPSKRKTG